MDGWAGVGMGKGGGRERGGRGGFPFILLTPEVSHVN